jgi:hypothetical protein
MASFQINGTDPPTGYAPGGRNILLERPGAASLTGSGVPCAIIGLPKLRVRFQRLGITGWEWYAALTSINVSVAVTNVRCWDPWKSGGPGWVTFSNGRLHRPTYKTYEYGAYTNVEILITELA